MKCKRCKKGRVVMQVSVFVECPAEQTSFGKKAIRSKNVVILGADWPGTKLYCDKCGRKP